MSESKKKLSTANKATAVGGGTGAITAYGALLASQKWGVPIEVSAAVVGTVFAFISRWAGKLLP